MLNGKLVSTHLLALTFLYSQLGAFKHYSKSEFASPKHGFALLYEQSSLFIEYLNISLEIVFSRD